MLFVLFFEMLVLVYHTMQCVPVCRLRVRMPRPPYIHTSSISQVYYRPIYSYSGILIASSCQTVNMDKFPFHTVLLIFNPENTIHTWPSKPWILQAMQSFFSGL